MVHWRHLSLDSLLYRKDPPLASGPEPKSQHLQAIQTLPAGIVQSVAEPSIPLSGPRIRTPPSAEEVEVKSPL